MTNEEEASEEAIRALEKHVETLRMQALGKHRHLQVDSGAADGRTDLRGSGVEWGWGAQIETGRPHNHSPNLRTHSCLSLGA